MDKRLFRSRTDRLVAGVCGGLGSYFDIDPVFIRALFLIGLFGAGVTLIAYFILWLIVPEEGTVEVPPRSILEEVVDDARDPAHHARRAKREHYPDRGLLAGLVLIAIGAIFLAENIFDISFAELWPFILIAFGLGLLIRGSRSRE